MCLMTVTKKQLESNLWKFYLTKIQIINLAVPIITLYFLSKGLTITEVFALQAIFGILLAVLEIPTGAISDLLGRKNTIIVAKFTYTLGLFTYAFFARDFYGFLLAESMFAFGSALLSGTDNAFLYDTLKKLKRTHDYKKILSNVYAFALIVASVLTIIGGFLATISLDFPLKIAAFASILIFISMFSFTEPPFKRKGFSVNSYINQISKNIKFTFTHKRVRWLTLFTGMLTLMGIAGFWYYQPYMKVVNLNVIYFGIFFASINLVAAIASKLAVKIEDMFGEDISLVFMAALPILSFFVMGKMYAIVALSAIWFQQISRGIQTPIISSYINDHLDYSNRATVLSMSNFVSRSTGLIVLPILGYLVDVWSIRQSMLIAGGLFSLIFISLFLIKPKD